MRRSRLASCPTHWASGDTLHPDGMKTGICKHNDGFGQISGEQEEKPVLH